MVLTIRLLKIINGLTGSSINKSTAITALHTIFAYNLTTSNTHFLKTTYIIVKNILHQQYINNRSCVYWQTHGGLSLCRIVLLLLLSKLLCLRFVVQQLQRSFAYCFPLAPVFTQTLANHWL